MREHAVCPILKLPHNEKSFLKKRENTMQNNCISSAYRSVNGGFYEASRQEKSSFHDLI
jgi:hypothetical protein